MGGVGYYLIVLRKQSESVLHIPRGSVFGYDVPLFTTENDIQLGGGTHYLLGKNGLGKTTLLKTLSGLHQAMEGRCEVSKDVLYVPEDLAFDHELSAEVILRALLSKEAYPLALELSEEIGLATTKPFGQLSSGNKRKVLFLLAEFQLYGRSGAVVMMDEPFSGLDQEMRQFVHQRWNQDAVTRVVSHHPANVATRIRSALIIKDGQLTHREGDYCWEELKSEVL